MDEFSSEYEASIIRGFSECFFENATLLLSPVIVAVPHSISVKNALLFNHRICIESIFIQISV